MKRWSLRVSAVASFVICLAAAGSWIRSYWRIDVFGAQTPVSAGGRCIGGSLGTQMGLIELHLWSRNYLRRPTNPESGGVVHFSNDFSNPNLRQNWVAALGDRAWHSFGFDRRESEAAFRVDSNGRPVRYAPQIACTILL